MPRPVQVRKVEAYTWPKIYRTSLAAMFGIILVACSSGQGGSVTAPPPPSAMGPQVTIKTGTIEGTEDSGADAFKGIAYAAPPIGPLRFKPPSAATSFSGVRNTQEFSPACSQPASTQETAVPPLGSEDCLYLNVWSPSDRDSTERLPIMVFLHGGANLIGSAAESTSFVLNKDTGTEWYDGAKLAADGGVIVVTLNYRLGTLGFLAHESLVADGSTGSAGNYGLMDQLSALQWVQSNIETFGGDRSRVMLFGQSAGAYDVCTLVASPLAVGLFSRAAMHSGSCAIQTLPTARANAEILVNEVGCGAVADIPACLRALPAAALSGARAALPVSLGSFRMYPAVDRYFVNEKPLGIIGRGEHNDVPILIGSNAGEYSHQFQNIPDSSFETVVANIVGGSNKNRVLELYPLTNFASADEAVTAIVSDRNITCPTRLYATTFSQNQTQPVFRYHFRRILSSAEKLANSAYHSTELLYLFQRMDGTGFSADDDDRRVEQAMLNYWTRFAANGDPNHADEPAWLSFTAITDNFQVTDVMPFGDSGLATEKCDFWLAGLPDPGDPPGRTIQIGALGKSLGDPEFLGSFDRIAYQGATGEVWLATLDPVTGLFDPAVAERLATGAVALIDSFNGPEFGLDADGWAVFFTKLSGGVTQIWRSSVSGAGVIDTAVLTSGAAHTTAITNQNSNSPDIKILNINGSWSNGVMTWFEDVTPSAETQFSIVDSRETTHPTWVNETDFLFYREPLGATTGQLFLYDTNTGLATRVTDDAGDKTFPVGWLAPEFGGAMIVLALIDKTTVGIYRDAGGAFWDRIANLTIPDGSNGITVGSAEPVIVGNKSYISLSIQNSASSMPGVADAEIWIFDIEDDLFSRIAMRCDDQLAGPRMRIDPETYPGSEQLFVYYNVFTTSGTLELYRCATGIAVQ